MKGNLYLECKLTEAELKESGKKLADAIQKKTEVEARVESFKTQAKGEIAEIDATIGKMSALVNNEKEFRNVECEITWDFKKGLKSFIRKDTGEIAKTEKISEEERQRELDEQPVPAAKK
jgi:hypothetical protein